MATANSLTSPLVTFQKFVPFEVLGEALAINTSLAQFFPVKMTSTLFAEKSTERGDLFI